ncbi:MAG: hypothetical protein KDA37_14365 [Planctomycetales bacterium]|nr:hypothetical protein [Planctomycetales bacterium]
MLLLAFAVAATGVPLSLPRVARESVGRFPCENCGCGCHSASVCWTNCCCHTMAQRLAWAQRENVRPPEEALVLAQRQGLDVSRWLRPQQLAMAAGACTTAAAGEPKRACCCCCKAKAPAETAPQSKTARATSTAPSQPIWQAAACQGALKFWLSISVVKDDRRESAPAPPRYEPMRIAYSTDFSSVALAPPTPPPERLV